MFVAPVEVTVERRTVTVDACARIPFPFWISMESDTMAAKELPK